MRAPLCDHTTLLIRARLEGETVQIDTRSLQFARASCVLELTTAEPGARAGMAGQFARGHLVASFRRPMGDRPGTDESPTAAAGQEEADEKVVLRMRVDVVETEHGGLDSEEYSARILGDLYQS
jgi:hypothetical protein